MLGLTATLIDGLFSTLPITSGTILLSTAILMVLPSSIVVIWCRLPANPNWLALSSASATNGKQLGRSMFHRKRPATPPGQGRCACQPCMNQTHNQASSGNSTKISRNVISVERRLSGQRPMNSSAKCQRCRGTKAKLLMDCDDTAGGADIVTAWPPLRSTIRSPCPVHSSSR